MIKDDDRKKKAYRIPGVDEANFKKESKIYYDSSRPEIPEPIAIDDKTRMWICEYCYPRGEYDVKKVMQCPYCNDWFCSFHYRPYRSNSDDNGHPCPDYKK